MTERKRKPQRGKSRNRTGVNIRALALDALLDISRGGERSDRIIGGTLDKYDYLEAREKAFFKRLTEGTLERRIELDYCIGTVSSVPVGKMKPLIRELLRMSAYQILFMDGIPDSAACDEAVKLAARHSFRSLKGFVNGVLRSLCGRKGHIAYPDPETERTAYLSVRYSMPAWLIEKWDSEQGQGDTERILQGLLEEKPVTIRLRERLSDAERAAVRRELERSGALIRESAALPFVWHLKGLEGLKNNRAFAAGLFTVQDISSVLAVEAAGIREGDFVLDVCAAPGGKALFAAEKAGACGRVLARDVSGRKLALLEESRRRLQADALTAEQWDARQPDENLYGRADVVLADVPCSGLGVIGKKQDIKYRVGPEEIESLLPLQRQILETVQRYVKPGGILLYSTCTVSRAENEEMMRWFLERFPFRAGSLRPFLPAVFSGETTENGYFQFLPGIHDTDGFFMARLVRE